MLSVIPSDGLFNPLLTTIIDPFSCKIIFKVEYPLFYQVYAENNYIFNQELFGSAPFYVILTSCMRSFYTPSCKTEISRTDENGGKPRRVCKNQFSAAAVFR